MKKKLVVCALVLCVLATLLAVPAMAEAECTHAHTDIIKQHVYHALNCTEYDRFGFSECCQDCGAVLRTWEENGDRGPHAEVIDKTVDPTCVEAGYIEKGCTICLEKWTEPNGNALGHVPQEGAVVHPCQSGTRVVDCARCKEKFQWTYVQKEPHKPAYDWVVTKTETCTENGLRVRYCTVCGDVAESETIDEIPGHDWKITGHQDPTCQSNGYDTLTCSRCGLSQSNEIPPCGHNFDENNKAHWVKVPADCGNDGYIRAYCIYGCGEYITIEVLASNGAHEWEWIVEPATCTAKGKKTPHCQICDKNGEPEILDVIPHPYKETIEEPTCQHPGYKHYVCEVCGYKTDVKYANQLDHNLGSKEHVATCAEDGWTDFWCINEGCDFKTTVKGASKDTVAHKFTIDFEPKPATCTEGGWTRGKKCEVCGKWARGEVVAPLGHEEVKVEAVAATCDAAGSNAGVKCSRCGVIVSGCEVVAATGHEKVTDAAAVAATCDKAGSTEAWHCKNCTYAVKAETIPALGHKEETLAGKAATCTKKGITEGKKCTVCGAVTVAQKEIAALGHKEVKVAGKAATCTEKGLTDGKKCSVCGVVTVAQKEIAALGHKAGAKVVTKAATCTEKGTATISCTVCKTVLETKEIAALGHKAGAEVVTKAATCTEKGTATISCTVCKTVLETKEIAALGHKAGELVVVNDSTCRKTGTATISCTVCGVKLEDKEIARKEHRYDKQSTCLVCGYNPFGGSANPSSLDADVKVIVVNANGMDAKYTSTIKDGVQTVTVTETVADGTYYILKISKDTLAEFKNAGASTVDFVVGKAVLSIPMAALESVDLSSGELQFSVPVGEGQFSAQLLKNDVSADQTDAMTAAGVVVK